ncbi:MAG: LLM class flavin-dependent oxidoreductase [Aggregatilineales bacterium]
MVNTGIMFKRHYPPQHLPAFAKQAEASGFDEIWVVEDCFYAGGIAQAATAIAHTSHAHIGLGIMPAVARNAAFTALEIASLASISNGRFLPGIGHGVRGWMQQINALPESQLGALAEHTSAIRAILRGERVTVTGSYVHLDDVALEYPLAVAPPVQLGVRGPKSLQVSGRVADGTILAEGCSPDYIRWAREQINIGRNTASRDDKHHITIYIYWSMADDDAAAIQTVKHTLADRILADKLNIYAAPMNILENITQLAASHDKQHIIDNIPDEWVRQLSVSGSTEDCVASIHRLADAGADSVVLVPMMDNDTALNVYAPKLFSALK